MQLNNDWREFIESLNANKVEYLIVGAFAVAWYGYPRFTADIDFFVRPDPDNAARVVRALSAFGFSSLGLQPDDLSVADCIVQIGVKPNRIDIITSIAGVSFDEAWAARREGTLDGVPVSFIGPDELIRNKESTGRHQDASDAQALRKRRRDS